MQSPAAVAKLLSVQEYAKHWPDIPIENLTASSVRLPHGETWTDVLMHKRRVPAEALIGETTVKVCKKCHAAFSKKYPTLSDVCLANWMWLGRHEPIFQDANLGHQFLLALGRVVSTKVYLNSSGPADKIGGPQVREEAWRLKGMQQGMQGTAIVFGNANVDYAMASFPPAPEVVQETFVAVFTGPEDPTPEERELLKQHTPEANAKKDEMARNRLKKEVQMMVDKSLFELQAQTLRQTNVAYKNAHYNRPVVEKLPDKLDVPDCFTACARFVTVDPRTSDIKKAEGPEAATTAAAEEAAAGPLSQ